MKRFFKTLSLVLILTLIFTACFSFLPAKLKIRHYTFTHDMHDHFTL